MASHEAPAFRVCWPTSQRRLADQLGDRALDLGLGTEFLKDVRRIEIELAADPLAFGDPQYDFQHLGLTVYHALLSLIHVYYAVDEPRRLVYIKEVQLLPDSALGS